MSSHMSTKEKILHIVDDIELISKELIENLIAPKQQKLSSADHQLLTELLVSKDKDLKIAMKLASEQAAIEVKINAVKSEVERQVNINDINIGNLYMTRVLLFKNLCIIYERISTKVEVRFQNLETINEDLFVNIFCTTFCYLRLLALRGYSSVKV